MTADNAAPKFNVDILRELAALGGGMTKESWYMAWAADEIESLRKEALSAKLGRQDSEVLAFANEIISNALQGCDFSGGDIQDMAAARGLLKSVEAIGPCGEGCVCTEFGFPVICFRKTEFLSASIESAIPPGHKLVPIEPSPEMEQNTAFNLCAEFGLEFTQKNRLFALAAYRELIEAAPQPGEAAKPIGIITISEGSIARDNFDKQPADGVYDVYPSNPK